MEKNETMKRTRFHRRNVLLWTIGVVAGLLAGNAVGIAQMPSGSRIQNTAAARFAYRTGAVDSLRSNTVEVSIQTIDSLASSIAIVASPRAIPGNQQDTAFVIATVLDKEGKPVPDGVRVVFFTSRGRFLGGKDSVTVFTVLGRATISLRSDLVAGEILTATVSAMVPSTSRSDLLAQTTVMFFPGAIRGSVSSARTGLPIQGARIVVTQQGGSIVWRDSTACDGSYLVPLRAAGVYTRNISLFNHCGDQVEASFPTMLTIPTLGGTPASTPLNAIAGNLIDRSAKTPVRLGGVPVSLRLIRETRNLGGRSMPLLQTTDARGLFVFDSLNPGIYEVQVNHAKYVGSATISDTVSGCFMVETDVGLADRPGFEVTKVAHKRMAEIGDAVAYTLELRNTSATLPLVGINVVDELPLAFAYVRNSSQLNQGLLGDPRGSGTLRWSIPDTPPPGKSLLLSYMTTIGAGAVEGDGVNHAYAIAQDLAGDTVRSEVASAGVVVRPGVFTDRGIVIGKVFFDSNKDGLQQYPDEGISGVELMMEDGTRIVTGDDGKYSLPEVLPGQHVIRLNLRTLPAGSKVIAYGTESAGDGASRFIRLVEGGIARADFHVIPPGQASLEMIPVPTPAFEECAASYVVRWNEAGKPIAVSLIDTLPQGYSYDPASLTVNGSVPRQAGNSSRFLRLELTARARGSMDTVKVSIRRDTSSLKNSLSSRPCLVLSYPGWRDAVIRPYEEIDRASAPDRTPGATPIDGFLNVPPRTITRRAGES